MTARSRLWRRYKRKVAEFGANRRLTWPYVKTVDIQAEMDRLDFVELHGKYVQVYRADYKKPMRNGEMKEFSKMLKFKTKRQIPYLRQLKQAFAETESGSYLIARDIRYTRLERFRTRDVQTIRNLPVYGSALIYPHLGTKWSDDNQMCAYRRIEEDLGLTYEEVYDIVGKTPDQGLTPDDIAEIFEKYNRKVYLVDLKDKLISEALIAEALRNHHARVCVYRVASGHVYGLTDEAREKLLARIRLSKTPRTDVESVGHQAKAPPKAMELQFDMFDQAYERAVEFANSRELIAEQLKGLDTAAKEDKQTKLQELLAAQADAESRAQQEARTTIEADNQLRKDETRLRRNNRRSSPGPISSEEKRMQKNRREAILARIAAERRIRRASDKEAKRQLIQQIDQETAEKKETLMESANDGQSANTKIHLNVCSSNIYENYIKLLESGKAYPSDIDGMEVTRINISPRVVIFANPELKHIERTAQELQIQYNHQDTATLSWILFQRFARDMGWDKSYYNATTASLLDSDFMRTGGLNWSVDRELAPDEKFQGIDFYRHYPSIARKGGFYRVDVMDGIRPAAPYNPREKAIYYVETDDNMLFSGNGVYDFQVVEYALDTGLIKESDIKYKVPVQMSKTNDKLLGTLIDHVYKDVSNDRKRKELVNFLIGKLGAKSGKNQSERVLTTSLDEAHYYYGTMPKNKSISTVAHLGGKKETPIYLVQGKNSSIAMSSNRLVNMAIVQRGRLATYKLAKRMEECVEIVAIKTDCVVTLCQPNPIPTIRIPENPTFGSIRREEIIDDRFHAHEPTARKERFKLPETAWNIVDADGDEYFDPKALLAYKRVYVKGFAGSGKSHIAKALAQEIAKIPGRAVKKAAFTNKAGLVIDGQTFHNMLGITYTGETYEHTIEKFLKTCTDLITDEVSMIPLNIYRILTQMPDINIYGFGDFRQLAGIEDGRDKAHQGLSKEDSIMFKSLFNYNMVRLHKQCRANQAYANQCVEFYDNKESKLPDNISLVSSEADNLPDINISYTNKKRIEINNKKMQEYAKAHNIAPVSIGDRLRFDDGKAAVHTAYERFDAKKLAYIVRHKDQFPQIVDAHHREDHDVFLIPHKYLVNSVNGLARVQYNRSAGNDAGRLYAARSQSLQNITRQIRHTIAGDFWQDCDMENAHPRILQHICRKLGIAIPELDRYVGDRNTIIKRLMAKYETTKGPIKIMLLAIMNGGKSFYGDMAEEYGKDSWIDAFQAEVKRIHTSLSEAYPERYQRQVKVRNARGKAYNYQASFCNILMCEMEDRILMTMHDKFRAEGYLGADGDECVLCFDGIMIPRDKLVTDEYMRALEREITDKCDGIVIRLEIKAMLEGVEMPAQYYEELARGEIDINVRENEMHLINPGEIDEFPYLYTGMPVIANTNRRGPNGYLNNQDFNITEIKSTDCYKQIVLSDNAQNLIEIDIKQLQRHFRPRYCITVYKAQGATYTEPYRIHEWDLMREISGSKNGQYVALTRTTEPEYVSIVRDNEEMPNTPTSRREIDYSKIYDFDQLRACLGEE